MPETLKSGQIQLVQLRSIHGQLRLKLKKQSSYLEIIFIKMIVVFHPFYSNTLKGKKCMKKRESENKNTQINIILLLKHIRLIQNGKEIIGRE